MSTAVGVNYKWFSLGDVSSSATIVFDNLTNMAIIAFLLTVVFGMPAGIVFKHIIPGLSIGVVVGNVAFMYMAFRLSKKLGRDNVTAFPSGLDAPTCIGMTLAVVGPAFLLFKSQGMTADAAALQSWYVSCACCFFIGLVKFVCSFFVHKIKNALPTVALLGGLAGVAIGLIAFFPLLTMLEYPIVSFLVLAIIVMVYFAGYQLPANLPAILVAIVIGTVVYYVFQVLMTGHTNAPSLSNLQVSFPSASLAFFASLPVAVKFFSIAFPFALLVIFGTVAVAESAQVLGEDYSPNELLFVDGIATMLMGVFGGTAQTTPYAGFPAYKKMDSRAGYLLINIIVVGIGAWFGFVNYIIDLIPEAILAPVLLFIGIEIAIQVFMVCDKKYYPAAILGLFPSIARMVEIQFSSSPVVSMDKVNALLASTTYGKLSAMSAIFTFGNGFIVTGTLLAALVYYLIERRIVAAVVTCVVMALMSLCGIIHSVNMDGSMYWIANLPAAQRIIPIEYAGGYLMFALVAIIIHALNKGKTSTLAH